MNNYWDRGLTGIAVDPQFGTAGHNFVYVNYTYNRDPRDVPPIVPKWGDPGQQYDECPAPATADPPRAGCVVMMRVTRLTAVKNAHGWEMPAPRSSCSRAAASSSPATPPATSRSVRTASSTPRPATARASTPRTTARTATRARDPGDEGGSLRSQDFRTTATRSASAARSCG